MRVTLTGELVAALIWAEGICRKHGEGPEIEGDYAVLLAQLRKPPTEIFASEIFVSEDLASALLWVEWLCEAWDDGPAKEGDYLKMLESIADQYPDLEPF